MQKKTLKTVMHPVFGLLTMPPKELDFKRGIAEQLKQDRMQGQYNLTRDAASSHELLSIVLEVDEFLRRVGDPMGKGEDPEAAFMEAKRRGESLFGRIKPWVEGAKAKE